MRIFVATFFILFLLIFGSVSIYELQKDNIQGAPSISTSEESAPSNLMSWFADWKRPDVPAKVAIQVGHFKNDELPEELSKLRTSDGASAGGYDEWEVNLMVAKEIEKQLNGKGIFVELLPATVPEKYWADVFLAIHTDGSEDGSKRGYKIAKPWRDFSGNADKLIGFINSKYAKATGFIIDPNITRNMRGYYAFSWWRYDHSIHPMTTAAIVELGFLTNSKDREFLTQYPDVPATAITEGVIEYLQNEGLLE